MNDDAIRRWCAAHPESVLWDEPTRALLDVFSGKSLTIDRSRVQHVEEKRAADTDERYLLIVFADGRQLALAQAGIAFAPSTASTGPLPLPPVVCWRDFANVCGRAEHVVRAHPDEPPGRELLDMLLYCIALVDGARALGFAVDDDERRVETLLAEVERRKR